MAIQDVLTIDETNKRIEVPQVGDTYNLPRDVAIDGDLSLTGLSPFAHKGTLVILLSNTDVVLTAAQFANATFGFTGVLTANVNVIVPDNVPQINIWDNLTTGAFLVTVKHASSAGVVIPQTTRALAYTNGTTVEGVTAVSGGGAVTSVFGRVGAILATLGDYIASEITNTPAGNIIATDVQAAINELDTEKAIATNFTNVDNTSDINKPVSTAQQTAINLKEDALGNPLVDGGVLSSTIAGVRSWVAGGGGAVGGGTDAIFYENDQTMTTDYTLTTNKNAHLVGPLTINIGITLTIPAGSILVIA